MNIKLLNIKTKFLNSIEGTDDEFKSKRIIDFFNWLWDRLRECEDEQHNEELRKYIIDVFVEIDRPNEEWECISNEKDIIHSTYFISNWGRLKSVYRGKERILRPTININNLYLQYANLGTTAHRLVAENFIPNPEGKPIVDHINTNKILPIVTNLKWADCSENYRNPQTIENRRMTKYCKPVIGINITTGEEIRFESTSEASRKLKINYMQIINCCRGLRGFKTAGGWMWRYA